MMCAKLRRRRAAVAASWMAAALAAAAPAALAQSSGGAETPLRADSLIPIPNPFERYCERGGEGALIFLVDQTEVYDRVDRNRLAEGAIKMLNSLRYGQRLVIYRIDDTPGDLTPSLDLCVPGCPEEFEPDGGETIWEHACDRITIQREKQQFLQIFRSRAGALLDTSADTGGTELLRTLSTLSYEYQGKSPERLVIFSDMIEYSDLSRKVNAFDEETAEQLLRKATSRAPLAGAFEGRPVQVFGFGKRLGQLRLIEERGEYAELPFDATQAFRGFWDAYFSTQMKADPIEIFLNYPE